MRPCSEVTWLFPWILFPYFFPVLFPRIVFPYFSPYCFPYFTVLFFRIFSRFLYLFPVIIFPLWVWLLLWGIWLLLLLLLSHTPEQQQQPYPRRENKYEIKIKKYGKTNYEKKVRENYEKKNGKTKSGRQVREKNKGKKSTGERLREKFTWPPDRASSGDFRLSMRTASVPVAPHCPPSNTNLSVPIYYCSWRNNLNQVVDAGLCKGVYNLIEIILNEPNK